MLGVGPDPELAPYFYGVALVLCGIGAYTDWRTGDIPHWVSLPPLFLGPVVHGLTNGGDGLVGSLLGVVVCGVVPFVMNRVGGMAGGDVKLFAGTGALVGAELGLHAEFLSFVVAGCYALGRLAWDGKLLRTLGNSVYVGLNPLLPQRLKRPISRELMQEVRLGPAIFMGLAIAAYSRLQAFVLFGA